MFVSSFSAFPDSFRTIPLQSSNNLHNPPTNASFNNQNSQFYPQNFNSDIQRNFSTPMYQKPFISMSNDRIMDSYGANNVSDSTSPNVIDSGLMTPISDRQTQRNQYPNPSNLNFLPNWKQESNSWWVDDKHKAAKSTTVPGTPVMDDQSNSFFHYR